MFESRMKSLLRMEHNIVDFEAQPIVKNKILFYGDSTFTRWKEQYGNPNLEDVIRMKDGEQAVVNHGFGGSTSEEQLYYYPRAVRPWEPRALVLHSFGNDLSYAYSASEVVFLQTRILDYARADFPGIRLFYCNICPTLSQRETTKAKRRHVKEYDELVANYCAKHDDVTLVDHTACPDFYEEGGMGQLEAIRTDLHIEDKVHFNPQGYAIYGEFYKKNLADLL